MGLTHVVLDTDGPRLTLADARERIAQRGDREKYTPEIFAAMLATRQERDYVSTTSLTAKCLRQQSICRQYDYAESVDGMWASFRGTMFHGQLEKHAATDAFEEARFHVDLEVDGETQHLSGSPDVISTSGLLYDYKFCKEVPRWDRPWGDHVEQGQINRWLCDHATMVEWRGWRFYTQDNKGDTMEPIEGQVQEDTGTVTCVEDFRPVDWQGIIVVYMDDKGVKPLLCYTSIDVPKVSGEGTKKARVADIWTDEQVEELILDRYSKAHDALTLLNIPPAPAGWERQSHILCQYCPVRAICAELESEGK